MNIVLCAIVVVLTGTGTLVAQEFGLDVNLELTGARFSPNTVPERDINKNFREDDPFNPVRGKLFSHFNVNETFGIEGEFLFDNKAVNFNHTRDQPIRIDGLFAFAHGLYENKLNFWLGRIPTPVGTFSPRSYSHTNPLIGYPLSYHYKVPYNAFQLSSESSNLFLRDNNFGAATSIYEACWITGASVFGTIAGFDYNLAAGRGTLTNPEAGANRGFQIAGRIGGRIAEALSGGVSAGLAPYLEKDRGLPAGTSIRDPKHVIVGVDLQYTVNAFHLTGEAFANSWDTPQYAVEKSIQAYSWYLEGQVFLLPNLYTAARFDQMLYSDISDPLSGQKTPWGYNVTRIEAGVGFLPLPSLTLKAVVQHNILDNPATRQITIIALQGALHLKAVQKLVGL